MTVTTDARVLAVADLEGPCRAPNCGDFAVSVQVGRVGGSVGLARFCEAHTREEFEKGRDLHCFGLTPTCGGGDKSKCGALAMRLSVIDRRDGDAVPFRVVAVCARHARRGPAQIGPPDAAE